MGPPMEPPNWFWMRTGLTPPAGLKKPVALRSGIAEVFVKGAVHPVGAAAQGGVDHGASHPAVLGGEVVGLDFEFLHGVRGDLGDLVGEALVAGAVGIVVDAVELEIVEGTGQAVDVEGAFAAIHRAEQQGALDAGGQQAEVRSSCGR